MVCPSIWPYHKCALSDDVTLVETSKCHSELSDGEKSPPIVVDTDGPKCREVVSDDVTHDINSEFVPVTPCIPSECAVECVDYLTVSSDVGPDPIADESSLSD